MANIHHLSHPVFSEPVFSEGRFQRDPNGFVVEHPSDSETFRQLGDLLKKKVVSFEKSRIAAGQVYSLEKALGDRGPQVVQQIATNKKIVFHSTGDSGASNVRKFGNEIRVADQLAEDASLSTGADRPAFLFHLGDLVYDFGEAQYYYDQFYEPFRNYPAPIFAIPGNHDSFLIPDTPADESPLFTFARNFCATKLGITREARSLHRTAMTQPGVYFTLDAPFVRIVGLFSNALEDPGLISSEGGNWPGVPDYQLEYLAAQLEKVKSDNYKGAVLIAVHHPPFSYSAPPQDGGSGGNHSSSRSMLREIDKICADKGVYPHAFLTAHAHNYQRYTRTVKIAGSEYDVPFIVAGAGGHNVNPLVRSSRGGRSGGPRFGQDVSYMDVDPAVESGGLILEKFASRNYGYLRVEVDTQLLRIGFHEAVNEDFHQSRYDLVTVDLATHTMVAN